MSRRTAAGVAAATLVLAVALAPGVVSVAVAGFNGLPGDDFYEVFEDHELVVDAPGVLTNDLPEGDKCVISSDDSGLLGSIGLGVGTDGHFRFTPTGDFNGATSFTYQMGQLSGGCPSGLPGSATVTITVFELNDPPSILPDTACLNGITVAEDSGPYDDAGHCVQMLDFGPPDENNQSFDAWLTTTTHPELFAAKPKVTQVDGLFGRLSFKPAANANGTATVSVSGRDSGGTTDGGDDTSDPVKFKITITAVDDPTPVPPPTEEPAGATPEPTIEPTIEASADTTTQPASTAPATEIAPPGPGISPVASTPPDATANSGGLSPLAILLGVVLVVLVAGFAAAVYLPRRRSGSAG